MCAYPPQGMGISQIAIDVDKDWGGHTLTNLKKAIATGQPLTIEQMLALAAYAWTGETGENYCYALTQDTDYVYVGLDTTPPMVIKITKATMVTCATWTGEAGEDDCRALAEDTDYVYAGLNVSPAKVIKITKATMTTDSRWTGAGGENTCHALAEDTDYVYAGLDISPAKV
ncbi:unnamed protein product, partial [marine sediment metagenome]